MKARYSTDQQEIGELKLQIAALRDEESCRQDLEAINRRLDSINAEVRTIEEQLAGVRQQLLNNCRVVATTVYQTYLKRELAARQYDVVVVDEASMLPLPMVYYAAGLAAECVVVAGDFRQLPPIVVSDAAECQQWLKRDVFYAAGIDGAVRRDERPSTLLVLHEQYRMQGDICDLVNSFFYNNLLTSSAEVRTPTMRERPFPGNDHGLLYVDTSAWNPWAAYRVGTWSRYNVLHALLIRNLVRRLKQTGFLDEAKDGVGERLGVVSPFGAQCQLLARLIGEDLGVPGSRYASTVHRFQGNERDAMIFDLTDSTGCPVSRFLKSQAIEEDGARLLNVAVSRARLCTVFIANFDFLRQKLGSNSYIVRRLLTYLEKSGERLDVSDCHPFDPEAILASHQAATAVLSNEIAENGLTAFTEGTFYAAFEADCRNACRDIVIFSPFMTERGTSRWVELWRAKIAQGVKVRLVTRPPGDQGGSLEQGLAELIGKVRDLRVVVDWRARMHEKMAFIDGRQLWHGSLNILSHRDTSESMLRVESPAACEQVGRFVVARWIDEKSMCDIASQESPQCSACGTPMVWNTGRHGIWFECECGQRANASGRQRSATGSPPRRPQHGSARTRSAPPPPAAVGQQLPFEPTSPANLPSSDDRPEADRLKTIDAKTWYEIAYWGFGNGLLGLEERQLAGKLRDLGQRGKLPTSTEAQQAIRILTKVYEAGKRLKFPGCRIDWEKVRSALDAPLT